MKLINAIRMGGMEVLPLVEGGKGISISNGHLVRELGVHRRSRHVQCGQRRQLRRTWPAHCPGLSRPHPPRAARGAGRLRHPGRADPGPPRLRAGQRQRTHPRQHPVGDGRRRTHHHRGAGAGEGHRQRHHLRRRHAVPAVRHRRAIQRLLLPDRLLGARLQRVVEARLLQGRLAARRRGVRGPVARRRPQRPVQQRGPDQARRPVPARARAAQADARVRPARDTDHHGRRRVVAGGMAGLDRQSRARARWPSSSARARC